MNFPDIAKVYTVKELLNRVDNLHSDEEGNYPLLMSNGQLKAHAV